MSNNPFDKQFLADEILRKSGGRIDKSTLNAAMNGNSDALLNKLNPGDRKKIESIMADKNALQKLMSNPAMKDLMNKLKGNGN